MDVGRLVQTVLHLTGFDVGDGGGDVRGDGAGLGVGHEALGAQQTAQTAHQTHHVGSGHGHVETEPALFLDLFHHVFRAHEIGAGGFGFFSLVALGEDQDLAGDAGAAGQHHGAADLLVGLTGVQVEADGQFHGLVEFGLGVGFHHLQGFRGFIESGKVRAFHSVAVFLAMFRHKIILLCGRWSFAPPTCLSGLSR